MTKYTKFHRKKGTQGKVQCDKVNKKTALLCVVHCETL